MNEIEIAVLDFLQNVIKGDILDFVMPKITALGNAGILWIILTLIFLISKKYRKTGVVMAIALVLDLIFCNMLIKPLVARQRPFHINPDIILMIDPPGDHSFPSGHTAASFAAAGAMYFSKYVSLSSIITAVVAVITTFFPFATVSVAGILIYRESDFLYTIIIVILAILLIFKHRTNISRILNGTEPKIKWM